LDALQVVLALLEGSDVGRGLLLLLLVGAAGIAAAPLRTTGFMGRLAHGSSWVFATVLVLTG
jgi:hypothetical protein